MGWTTGPISFEATPGPYDAFHALNSGYRTPVHNASVGGQPNSRHMWGDASDLKDNSGTLTELTALNEFAIAAEADYTEPESVVCPSGKNCGHAHADWRRHPGLYAP